MLKVVLVATGKVFVVRPIRVRRHKLGLGNDPVKVPVFADEFDEGPDTDSLGAEPVGHLGDALCNPMAGQVAHVINQRPENLLLAGEVHVESTQGHAGPLGDSADRRLVEAFLSKLIFGCRQQLLTGLTALWGLWNTVRS